MSDPNLVKLDPSSFDVKKIQLGDEVILTIENQGSDIPARIVIFDKKYAIACTDYYESLCGSCDYSNCLFNLRYRKEG